MTKDRKPDDQEPDVKEDNSGLLQDMQEWKREIERRIHRLEAAVDVIRSRRQENSAGAQGA